MGKNDNDKDYKLKVCVLRTKTKVFTVQKLTKI